ncbi:hypothetical protein H6P81_019927 [Aristolochia fimbriata]|uniref:Myb-like domain-containing protein n=1 Tax=Aristolochia fimbriata TaxID=158543 RepID=A0AAV7DT37_ARIFI|nr:hypothetical protein H6P81_019927 [Aristolochia fimbriata]
MVLSHNKRPYNDEESFQFSYKHPRQLEYSSHLSPFVDIATCNNILEKTHTSGGGGLVCTKSIGEERHANNKSSEFSVVSGGKEIETNRTLSRISTFSWATSCNAEDTRAEPLLPMPCSPEFLDHDRLSRPEDMYTLLVDYPPRKPVAVGPDHQADVPGWVSQRVDDDGNSEVFMGTCVTPMPNAVSLTSEDVDGELGHGRNPCSCPDEGSIRCVRQHVMEARERLRVSLGEDTFVELGFCDMGEDVADKWSEEEEQVFHEVVFSNPASMGKNFWDHLPTFFPSRTMKELISYYFNVFMLRRRAEQNRLVPLNVDSDNDEWQGSEDGDEFGMTEEEDEEDSGVESPADQAVFNEDAPDDEDDQDDGSFGENDDGCPGDDDDGQLDGGGLKAQISCKLNADTAIEFPSGRSMSRNGPEDHDVQDDSCTSYESQHNGADCCGPSDGGGTQEGCGEVDRKQADTEYGHTAVHNDVDHGFTLDHCDHKVWEMGFLGGTKKDIELLPTYNMIEEVFGEEAWNCNANNNETRSGSDFM